MVATAAEQAITVFLIGVALSLDTFSVAAALGAEKQKGRGFMRKAASLAALFSSFHFAMPLLGYFAGTAAKQIVMNVDHWIAFTLLLFVGGKMISGAKGPAWRKGRRFLAPADYLSVAVATSIDAFAIGITLAFLGLPILVSAGIIAATNFVVSLSGVYFGRFFGAKLREKAELAGGLVLIAIGAKVLVEHLFFQ